MKRRFPLIYWLPVPLYYAFITLLSGSSPKLDPNRWPTLQFDKVFHFVEYFFFGLILSRDLFWHKIFFSERRKWIATFVMFMGVLIPLDELHQYFTPGRHVDPVDAFVDFFGAFCGAVFFAYVIRGGRNIPVAKKEDFIRLQQRDAQRFSLVLVVIMLFIVVSANVLSIKEPLESRWYVLGIFLHLMEWGVLGYFDFRAVRLNRRNYVMGVTGWILVMLCFAVNLAVYQTIASRIAAREFSPFWVGCFATGFLLGVVVKSAKLHFAEMRVKLNEDPTFQRTTWQRVYYFYWPIVFAFLILGQAQLGLVQSQGRTGIAVTGFALYFLMTLSGIRGVAWESWWHETARKKWVWIGFFVMQILVFSGAQIIRLNIDGELFPSILTGEVLAVLVAVFLYITGYGYAVSREKHVKKRKKPFYMTVKGESGEKHEC